MAGPINVVLENNATEIGGKFVGHVTYDANLAESRAPSGLQVCLRVYTEGRGDIDSQIVWTVPVGFDSVGNASQRFEIPVPPYGPISYDGQLIRVRWEIRASIDLKLRRDKHFITPVLVIPSGGWGTYQQPHPLRQIYS